MTDSTASPDLLVFEDPEKKKIPSALNTLTILTFIGCALSAISVVYQLFIMRSFQQTLERSVYYRQQVSSYQNRQIETAAITLGSIVLCFIGAWMVRKMKTKGFWFYALGELLPVISSVVLSGRYAFTNWLMLANLAYPILFVILYATQLKHMKRSEFAIS